MAIDAKALRALLHYDCNTGEFVWTAAARRNRVGKVAGYINEGYRIIAVGGRMYKAHRLAWLHVHGALPVEQIDHIDGDRSNNRIANLRECSNAENQQNLRRSYRNSQAGMLGASFDKKSGRWRAQIQVSKRKEWLGWFDTAEEAHAAYLTRKRQVHTFCSL